MREKQKGWFSITLIIITFGLILLFKSRKRIIQELKNVGALPEDMYNDKFHPILFPMSIRNDSEGSGEYLSQRNSSNGTKRQHQGIDYLCQENQEVYSPFDGEVIRQFNAYSDSTIWKGIEIKSNDGIYSAKIMYLQSDMVGKKILKGQRVGFSQAIHKKYNNRMKDHIHFELRALDKLVNPSLYF